MREKKLIKNTIIISIGKICTSLITFLLLPLYTGILSTGEYGIVDLLNTLIALLAPLVGLQIEKGIFRELIEARENENKKGEIITTGFISLVFQCLFFIILFMLISPLFQNNYKIFLVINVLCYILVSFLQQITRGLDYPAKYAVGSFINAGGTIIFNVLLLVVFKLGIYGMLLGTFLGFVSSIVYYIISLKMLKYIKFKNFKVQIFKSLIKYSLPLIPNALSWWVFAASDRVIVSTLLGVDMNGILAASLKFSTIMTTLYNIFDTSWTESISANINDKDIETYFNKIFNISVKLFSSIGIGMIAFLPFVFPLMINKNYSVGYYLVPISIISTIFNVIQGLVAAIYIAKKNTKSIAKTSVFAAIINTSMHLLLIKFIGLYAAVVSTLIAFTTLSLYRFFNVNKLYFKIKLDFKVISISIIALAFVTLTYYINNFYFNLISIIVSITFAILINKESFSFFKNYLYSKFGKIEKNI